MLAQAAEVAADCQERESDGDNHDETLSLAQSVNPVHKVTFCHASGPALAPFGKALRPAKSGAAGASKISAQVR